LANFGKKNDLKILDTYEFKRKIVTYVKDEGSNLNNMTIVVKSILNCEVLGLEKSF
jgi:hypothetical protein